MLLLLSCLWWTCFLQGDEIYDATLNQTNVGDNNNKFYILQVLGLSCRSIFADAFLQFILNCQQLSDIKLVDENTMFSKKNVASFSFSLCCAVLFYSNVMQ
jgi:hypothetical protein